MAERRMFTQKIIDSDAFLDMPLSTQSLYFHLNMRADDDGFVNNPKKIQRMIGASDDDLRLLLAKRFILGFENGIVVIKHWRMHNLLRKDRYNPTQYIKERNTLMITDNGSYTEKPILDVVATTWQPNGNQMATQDSIGKDSIDKLSIVEDSVAEEKATKRKRFVPPTLEDVKAYCQERQNGVDAERFIDYYTSNGWLVGKNKMKDWKAAVRTWERNGYSGQQQAQSSNKSYDLDDFFETAVRRSFNDLATDKPQPKTAGEDEAIRQKAEALKAKLE